MAKKQRRERRKPNKIRPKGLAREVDQKAPKMNIGILARGRVAALATAKLLVSISSPSRININSAITFPLCLNINKITFYRYHHKRHQLHNPLIMSQADSSGGVSASASAGISSTVPLENGGDSTVFPLSSSSVLKINKGDITQWFVDGSSDAIVNPANERMLGGGGADGAIHRAAGPELRDACYNVPEVRPGVRCATGEARITPGFNLPSSHVIHTVGPIYDVDANPEGSLRNAYRNSLIVAKDNNIKYIAFPAISCGVYRYPYDEAATVAISTVKEFANDLKEVHFVLFVDEIYNVWLTKAQELLQA